MELMDPAENATAQMRTASGSLPTKPDGRDVMKDDDEDAEPLPGVAPVAQTVLHQSVNATTQSFKPNVAGSAAAGTHVAELRAESQLRAGGGEKGSMTFPDYAFATPDDPRPNRTHVFVIGAETTGTRALALQLARDLNVVASAFEWNEDFGSSNDEDAVFHISLPWGSTCDHLSPPVEPSLSTWGADYTSDGRMKQPPNHPERFNLDVGKLLATYASKGEKALVVLTARDPEVSLIGKEKVHCHDKELAVAEQTKAYELLQQGIDLQSPNVVTVCYETLVADADAALAPVRQALGVLGAPTMHEDGNLKYASQVPQAYECNSMLATYRQMCPSTPLSAKYADCTHSAAKGSWFR